MGDRDTFGTRAKFLAWMPVGAAIDKEARFSYLIATCLMIFPSSDTRIDMGASHEVPGMRNRKSR